MQPTKQEKEIYIKCNAIALLRFFYYYYSPIVFITSFFIYVMYIVVYF